MTRYSIAVIKDEQCIKYLTSNDLDLIVDYFRIYNSPDYEIFVMDLKLDKLIIAYKDKGLKL